MIITIIKFIGGLLVATGVGLIINKKKQKAGVETWEGNHGIIIKTWHIILCMVLGILLIFVSNGIQNAIEYGLIASKSSSSRSTDTDITAEVVEHSKAARSSEPSASSELLVPEQQDTQIIGDKDVEQNKTENTSDYEQYDFNVGDVSITLNLNPAWDLYFGDSFITGQPDANTIISYMDSYISLEDKTNIHE